MWENGVLVLDTMKELVSRFPSRKINAKKLEKSTVQKSEAENSCTVWDNIDQPVQLQVCRRQNGDVTCPSLLDLIKQACKGKV